jgi:hypothetical protein
VSVSEERRDLALKMEVRAMEGKMWLTGGLRRPLEARDIEER